MHDFDLPDRARFRQIAHGLDFVKSCTTSPNRAPFRLATNGDIVHDFGFAKSCTISILPSRARFHQIEHATRPRPDLWLRDEICEFKRIHHVRRAVFMQTLCPLLASIIETRVFRLFSGKSDKIRLNAT